LCRIDSDSWVPCNDDIFDVINLTDGSHQFEVKAWDRAGNAESRAVRYTWTVDTVQPTVEIQDVAPKAYVKSTVNVMFMGNDPEPGTGISLYACRVEISGVDIPEEDLTPTEEEIRQGAVRMDGEYFPCQSPIEVPVFYADATYTVTVRAKDGAGNFAEKSMVSWRSAVAPMAPPPRSPGSPMPPSPPSPPSPPPNAPPPDCSAQASCAAGSMLRPISLRSPTDFESWCQCVSVLYAKINMLDLAISSFVEYELRFRKALAAYLQLQVADQVVLSGINPGSVVVSVFVVPGHWEGNFFEATVQANMLNLLSPSTSIDMGGLGTASILESGTYTSTLPPTSWPSSPMPPSATSPNSANVTSSDSEGAIALITKPPNVYFVGAAAFVLLNVICYLYLGGQKRRARIMNRIRSASGLSRSDESLERSLSASASTTPASSSSGNSTEVPLLVTGQFGSDGAALLGSHRISVTWGGNVVPGHTQFMAPHRREMLDKCRLYAYEEMRIATADFSNALGEGGSGTVYAGAVEIPVGEAGVGFQNNGQEFARVAVAIKRLERGGTTEERQFYAEVATLSRLAQHDHLVRLVGCCAEGMHRMLVLEMCNHGTVSDVLAMGRHQPGGALTVAERLEIALGAAKGLDHLHLARPHPLVHRDFKSANILLAESRTHAKVSDFGLARLCEGMGVTPIAEEEEEEAAAADAAANQSEDTFEAAIRRRERSRRRTHVSTAVMGTVGYVAPEYALAGHLSAKSDVWSYGVTLLELLTGLGAVTGGVSLVERCASVLEGQTPLSSVADSSTPGGTASWAAVADEYAALCGACLDRQSRSRPSMSDVISRLATMLDVLRDNGHRGGGDTAAAAAPSPILAREDSLPGAGRGGGGLIEPIVQGGSRTPTPSANQGAIDIPGTPPPSNPEPVPPARAGSASQVDVLVVTTDNEEPLSPEQELEALSRVPSSRPAPSLETLLNVLEAPNPMQRQQQQQQQQQLSRANSNGSSRRPSRQNSAIVSVNVDDLPEPSVFPNMVGMGNVVNQAPPPPPLVPARFDDGTEGDLALAMRLQAEEERAAAAVRQINQAAAQQEVVRRNRSRGGLVGRMYRAIFGTSIDASSSRSSSEAAARPVQPPPPPPPQPTAWEVRERYAQEMSGGGGVVDDAHLCQICLELPRNVQNLPCGHLCCCRACAETLIQRRAGCPLCREPMTGMRDRAYTREGDTFLGPVPTTRTSS